MRYLGKTKRDNKKADEAAEASDVVAITEESLSSAIEDLTSDDKEMARSSGVSLLSLKHRQKQVLISTFIIMLKSCKCF